MKIKKIEIIERSGDVYNLHVQDNHNYFVDGNCVKNCHGAKAFVSKQIMQEAVNSVMRVGLTATIPKNILDKANVTSGFGPVVYEVKGHELQARKILATIDINVVALKYPQEYVYSFLDWHEETIFLQSNAFFQEYIRTLIDTIPGNILILLKNREPAEKLAEFLGCTYIDSKLSVEKRQVKFKEFVYNGRQISTGTYSLLSTGIDIVHINSVILGPSPGKSYTKVLQSIGRGMRRKAGQKEHIVVYDLTSNLKFDKKHISDRKSFYTEAKYPFVSTVHEMVPSDVPKKISKKKPTIIAH